MKSPVVGLIWSNSWKMTPNDCPNFQMFPNFMTCPPDIVPANPTSAHARGKAKAKNRCMADLMSYIKPGLSGNRSLRFLSCLREWLSFWLQLKTWRDCTRKTQEVVRNTTIPCCQFVGKPGSPRNLWVLYVDLSLLHYSWNAGWYWCLCALPIRCNLSTTRWKI